MAPRTAFSTQSSEEARAFVQQRVALFWKFIFFLSLLSLGLGAAGVVVKPSVELVAGALQTIQAGATWWLCARGRRSILFSQVMETGGLLINFTTSALLGRFVLVNFSREHGLIAADSILMADGYVTMLHVAGLSLMLAIRAALVPSSLRRTIFVTVVACAPLVACTAVVPAAHGGLAWRPLEDAAYPWLPMTVVMMVGLVTLTCSVISQVIFGLRAEVREARKLGQYVLERKIGEGGMGTVYRAHHGMLRRPSALKLLRGDRAGALDLQRFEREVHLTARLTHPNTITVFDYGRTDDGVFYYAMELLEGANLQRIVGASGPQPEGRVVRILTMVCGALAEAHAVGLIHRDIKPANIMLCAQGGELDVVKLLDFGLVKELRVSGDVELSAADSLTGTPQYMAPESIRAPETVDARTDIYALGAVAYFLLAGAPVFAGKTVVEVCSQHLSDAPQALAQRGVAASAALEALVLACLEKDPGRRPQSAVELRQRLEACAIEPWTNADAKAWWARHQPVLELPGDPSTGDPRTIQKAWDSTLLQHAH
jgi:serine/threonine-protein kinase